MVESGVTGVPDGQASGMLPPPVRTHPFRAELTPYPWSQTQVSPFLCPCAPQPPLLPPPLCVWPSMD
eukprot:SAG31_NODE_15767_length_727_cov_2.576563_1_plen_66_part_10